jgi:16S rRNA (cytosine967-C5)-methyltransferase
MQYIHKHISSLLSAYKGEMPLANFLKFYFKKHPILGSRDRKILSEMAYCYYRSAKGLLPQSLSLSEKINSALLLSESNLSQVKQFLPEQAQSLYGKSFEENRKALHEQKIGFNFDNLCDKEIVFSEGINKADWLRSMLSRPKLFLKVVPQYYSEVLLLLQEALLVFETFDDCGIALPNGTSVEKILSPKMYRIQDASSQQTANFFQVQNNESCWDCCSGAGGKSLLIKDIAPRSLLCVSDVRKSILDNLAERFHLYGYPIPERLLLSVADEQQTRSVLANRRFDHIIADVPCSGSGTWARTPEQLYYFDAASLHSFSQRQKEIAHNALRYLGPNGGTFTYITCSVFAEENESVVADILEKNSSIKLLQQKLINGVASGADSMFVAVFTSK